MSSDSAGPRLIGRRRELAALERLVDGFERSRGGLTWIVGEPGIGKSTMLHAIAERADRRGGLVLTGGGAELERDVPYGVFVGALEDYLGGLAEQPLLDGLLPETLALLSHVFPSLGRSRPPDRLAGDERFRVHRALRALLGHLAVSRPMVLTLDDLQWADVASLEAIAHLVRQPPAGPLLFALAWREGQAPMLERTVGEAGQRFAAVEVKLVPLGEAEVSEMLRDDQLSSDTRAAVFRESGGNPFYAQQLAAAVGQGWTDLPDASQAGVPGPVLAAVRGELEQLSDLGQRLVRGAAVAGDPFALELAGACAELDDVAALDALDELLAVGLLVAGGSPRRFAFRHPVVRRAAYDWTPRGWGLGAHQRAARALAADGAPLAQRAHHLALSATAGDRAAAEVLAQAALSVQGYSPASAATWATAGLRILPNEEHDAGLRGQLLMTVARARGALGDLAGSHEAMVDALALARRDGGGLVLLSDVVRIEHLLGRWETARARLLEAAERLVDARADERAAVELELSLSSLFWLDFPAAAERAASAAEQARGVDPPLYAAALALQAFVAACAGQIAEARVLGAQAAQAVDQLGDEQLAARPDAAYYLGRCEYVLEQLVACERHLRRGIEVTRASGGHPHLVNLMIEHARALVLRGRLGEAGETTELLVGTLRLSDQRWALGLALLARVDVLRAAGDLAGAAAAGREASELIEATAAAKLALDARRQLAMVALEAGEPEQFLAEMRAAGTPDEGIVDPGSRGPLLEALVRAELACGRLEPARRWAQMATSTTADDKLQLTTALARRAHARIVLADGDPAGAAVLAGEAVRLAERAGADLEAARSRALAGHAHAQAGDREQAIADLQVAADQLSEYGAARERDQTIRRLRELGVRVPSRQTPARGSGAIAELSTRERDVAELVARGHTNRQIAETLFLSVKTIETHLARISAKLGVSGRAAIAAAVTRASTRSAGD